MLSMDCSRFLPTIYTGSSHFLHKAYSALIDTLYDVDQHRCLAAAALYIALRQGGNINTAFCHAIVQDAENLPNLEFIFAMNGNEGLFLLDACVCAPNGSLPTRVTDALLCLQVATGARSASALSCPCGLVALSD